MKQLVPFIKRRWLLLLIAAIAVIIGILAALQPTAVPLSVISTKPAAGAVVTADLLTEISVSLSRIPTANELRKLSLTLSPSLTVKSDTPVANTIRFLVTETPTEQTTYRATLMLGEQTLMQWEMNTALRLGGGLGDPKKYQEIYEQDIKDYPLLLTTPYETTDYTVFYSAVKTLTIKIKATIKTQAQMKQEVILWIKSQGGDPSAHMIVFK